MFVIPATMEHRATTCAMILHVIMASALIKTTVQNSATAITATAVNSVTIAKRVSQSDVKTAVRVITACATVQWITQASFVRK